MYQLIFWLIAVPAIITAFIAIAQHLMLRAFELACEAIELIGRLSKFISHSRRSQAL